MFVFHDMFHDMFVYKSGLGRVQGTKNENSLMTTLDTLAFNV